jgi:SAM-dependent methyltransferase
VSALVLLQVLHHLPQPRLFFAEASRTLRTGGRLILIEPWITPWSRIVYRFHREPCDPNARDWEAAVHSPLDGANEALPWIVFERDRRKFENEFPELAIRSIVPSLPLAYLLSGGFSFPAIAPGGAWPTIRRVEKTFDRMAAMFATIVLERR